MKKRIIKLSIFLLITIVLFTGCKIQSVEQYNNEKLPKVEEVTQSTKLDLQKEKDENDTEIKESDKILENDKKDKVENNEVLDKDEDDKNEINKSNLDKDKNKSETETKPQTKPQTKPDNNPVENPKPVETPKSVETSKPVPKPTPVKKYVTIQIRVDTILKNYDKLDPKLQSEKFVPANGTILNTSKFELRDGETAFDILIKATRQNRIHLDYQGGSSFYIKGINNIYEFSCGELSGWMYNVNGDYAKYAANLYKLKDGDRISFNYTCNLGRDLGQSGMNR